MIKQDFNPFYFSVHVTSFPALRIYKVNIATIPATIEEPNCNFDFLRLLKIVPFSKFVCTGKQCMI